MRIDEYIQLPDERRATARAAAFEHLADLLVAEAAVIVRRCRPTATHMYVRVELAYGRRHVTIGSVRDEMSAGALDRPGPRVIDDVEAVLSTAANLTGQWPTGARTRIDFPLADSAL